MLIKRFEDQVKKTPGNIAVKTESEIYTYAELNRYADGIARQISEHTSGKTVGLLFEHGVHMIAAILGALKAGKIYVPLSVDYPAARLSYMLTDSQSSLVLTNAANLSLAQELSALTRIPMFTIHPAENFDQAVELPARTFSADDTAYILYTSGSTGKPKGVYQTRRNADYYNRNWVRIFSITAADRMTLFSSFCHDGSVQDMFSALYSGAALYPMNMKNRENTMELSEFLGKERITIWHSVPSLFSYFANTLNGNEAFPHLRYILLGGEPVRKHEADLLKRFFPHCIMANVYGQTESSVNSICLIRPDTGYDKPKIGMPLDETQIFVIDEDGDPVEPLETGEIVVGCKYISPGYWKNPEATQKVFAPDEELGRLYWTGDLGRLLLDGSIEFMGRRDLQIKIRGFRVELGEIETRLLKHEDIKEAVVTAGEDKSGDKYLSAYVVTAGEENRLNTAQLRQFIARELPDYMVPAYFTFLDKMPLTPNGKIDRKSLPEPLSMEPGEDYVAPRDEVEETMARIWSEVLTKDKEIIGIDNGFFDLGGHSLKAVMLTSKLHKAFSVKVPLSVLFQLQNIRRLSEWIRSSRKTEFVDIEPVEQKDHYPLSYNQKRLWIIQQVNPGDTSYNMPGRFTLEHEVDVEAVRKSLAAVIQRHESFRTAFVEKDGEPFQVIEETVEVPLEFTDISSMEESEKQRTRENALAEEAQTPFDLSRSPLLRVRLVKWRQDRWDFIFNLHHIISDGWSQELLKRDFTRYYDAFRVGEEVGLEPLPLQYKDFAAWQNRQIENPVVKEQSHRFWMSKMKQGISGFQLPYDYMGNENNVAGIVYRAVVDNEVKEQIKQLAVKNNTTAFIVMFSAYNWMLSQYSGQEDIVCSIISAGREHSALQDIVGFFINSIAVKTKVDFEESFEEFLHRVDAEVMELFQYQGYPMELVLDELKMPYPEISVSFNMLNMQESSLEYELKDFEPSHAESKWNAKFALVLHTMEYKNGIELNWVYKKALFDPGTIEIISRGYLELLRAITAGTEEETRRMSYDIKVDEIKGF